MPPGETDNFTHVRVVVIRELTRRCSQNLYDPPAACMSDAFRSTTVRILPPNGSTFGCAQPLLELVGRHVHGLREFSRDLCARLRRLPGRVQYACHLLGRACPGTRALLLQGRLEPCRVSLDLVGHFQHQFDHRTIVGQRGHPAELSRPLAHPLNWSIVHATEIQDVGRRSGCLRTLPSLCCSRATGNGR